MKTIKGTKNLIADKPEPRTLPSFTLTSKDLPELKNWKVGGVYFLKAKVEEVSMGKGEYEYGFDESGKTKERHARFQMKGIEVVDEEKFEDEYGRKRSKV